MVGIKLHELNRELVKAVVSKAVHTTIPACFAVIGVAYLAALWLDLFRLVIFALLFALALSLLVGPSRPNPLVRIVYGLVLILPIYGYCVTSAFWSPGPDEALRDAVYMCISVFPAVALGIALGNGFTGLQIAYGLGMLMVPFALQALYGALTGGDPMLVGSWSMRSILTSIICLASPVLAGAWALSRRRAFFWYWLIVLALTVTIGSRSVLLFAIPAALVSVFLQDRRLAIRLIKWSLPLLILVVVANPTMLARFSAESTNLAFDEWSIDEELKLPPEERVDVDRRLAALTAYRLFLQNPIFGSGYASVLQTNRDEFGLEISAHGLIPGTLGELGLAGMAIFCAVIALTFVRARASVLSSSTVDRMLKHFVVALFAVLLLGLFHQTLESIFFGLSLGLVIGFGGSRRKSQVSLRENFNHKQAGVSSK